MALPDLATRFNFLMENVYPPNRGPWSLRELAALASAEGVPISEESLRGLQSGNLEDPPFALIKALATVFKVRLDFFGDDEKEWEDASTWILALRERLDSPDLAAARALRRRSERRARRARTLGQ